jgi:catechol 2,3-dioxygenase-like lactoylglutathione lyase family enzyme
MLKEAMISPTIPVTDVARAKQFYSDTLGLEYQPDWSDEENLYFAAGGDTYLSLYKRGPSTADHTLASFWVKDLDAEMSELHSKGVVFEEYDIPEMGLKTVTGVAEMGKYRGAWFKDPDGNILSIGAMTK